MIIKYHTIEKKKDFYGMRTEIMRLLYALVFSDNIEEIEIHKSSHNSKKIRLTVKWLNWH